MYPNPLIRIDARLARIERKLNILLWAATYEVERDMANKAEVQADMAEILKEAVETRGAAATTVLYVKELLDRINEAAASAADLDAFRVELALIKTEVMSTEDELKAAVEQNPA